ncbi:MAG: low molecular weight phosphotyrosine protein phosphatase [Verrucomicrobiales bacterium]|nr:low molecular weight phosphotyrosine protein phosphatase [Verrucomicrobiales bacterium]
MADRYSILFVCMGNICRSPSAENVMRTVAEREGVTEMLELDSAGTIDFHTGKSPDPRMTEAAEKRGIDMIGSARQVQRSDFGKFHLILAMDDENMADLLRWKKQHGGKAKLKMFCDFCGDNEGVTEVPDPYYGGPEGFELVLDLLEDGCSEIAKQVKVNTLE